MTRRTIRSRATGRLLLLLGVVPGARRLASGSYMGLARIVGHRLGRWPCVWAVDLRGSTAVQRAQWGRSDIDLHVVLHPVPVHRELVWLERFASEFRRLRRMLPVLQHVTLMARADKEAALRVGLPYSVGSGGISRRLKGPADDPATVAAREREDPFLAVWFSLLTLFSFYPRVTLALPGMPRPVHEHEQNLQRMLVCYQRLWHPERSVMPRVVGDVEHDGLRRYAQRGERNAIRRALWLRSSFEDQLANWVDLLCFWSDAARKAQSDDFAGLMAAPVSGQRWRLADQPAQREENATADLCRLEDVARRYGAVGIRVGRNPWQNHDRRVFVLVPEPVEIEQVTALLRALRRTLAVIQTATRAPTYPLPILVTEALFDLAFAFPKAPLDFVVQASEKTMSDRHAWLFAHGAQIEILRQVEMLRSKTAAWFAGQGTHYSTRLQDWAYSFFPAARLFVEQGLLCTSPRQALDCYLHQYDDASCETLRRYGALFAERAERPVGEATSHREVAGWVEDLYPCLQPIAVRLGQRLREAPENQRASFRYDSPAPKR